MVENGKDLNQDNEDVNIDGMAEVSNGVLQITSPRGQGKAVFLIPGEGADVVVNGEIVKEKQYIYAEDKIEINLVEELIPPKIKISISRDGMTAEAEVTPEIKITHELLDQPSLNVLKIGTDRIKTVTRGITQEEIMKALEEEQVVFGVDMDVVLELSESWETITRTIARGDPMEEGKDGYVEYLIKTKKELIAYKEDEARVDYRERYNIPQVSEGDILAIIHPPEEGAPGRRVTGEEILPTPVKEAVVICKEGAALSADRGQVVATDKGRPVIKKGREDVVYIEKYYVHYNDVSMESGNVKFQGHLKIEGSVEEGMTAFADGDIVVTRNTAGAKIIGGGDVNILGNCINCKVRAGGLQLLCQELSEILEFLRVSLEVAVENLDQITTALKQRGDFPVEKYPYILNTLLQSKFPEVNELMEKIRKMLTEKTEFLPPSNAMDRINELLSFFLDSGWEQAKNEKYLKKMYRLVDEALIIILAIAETKSDINIQYVQNSNLECTGNITVEGPGAYNSTFICGGKVVVKRLFRGGNIEAGDNVVIGELGSPGTSISHGLVHVPENNSIKLGKVHEGSRIRIGDRIYRLDSTYSNIKVYLDIAEDKVRVTYWR